MKIFSLLPLSFDAFYDIVSCVETHTSCVQSRILKNGRWRGKLTG
ncbi:MAG TPA: hypothetical protein PK358_06625 [Spirochaetota bacterium]|nr:hypothetical protein [Spirochaetota bacterium]